LEINTKKEKARDLKEQLNLNKIPKETGEWEVMSDPFETRPFEMQVKCGSCSSTLAVKLKAAEIGDSLNKASRNDKKMIDQCINCKQSLPSCAVCLNTITVLNPMIEFRNM